MPSKSFQCYWLSDSALIDYVPSGLSVTIKDAKRFGEATGTSTAKTSIGKKSCWKIIFLQLSFQAVIDLVFLRPKRAKTILAGQTTQKMNRSVYVLMFLGLIFKSYEHGQEFHAGLNSI